MRLSKFSRLCLAVGLILCFTLSGCTTLSGGNDTTGYVDTVSPETTRPAESTDNYTEPVSSRNDDTVQTAEQTTEQTTEQTAEQTGKLPGELPAEMEIRTESGRYVYNPYLLSAETLDNMGGEFAAFYVDFITAYLNYETSCPCPDREYALMLSTVLYYDFPLFAADGELKGVAGYKDGKLNWSYTAGKEEHTKLIGEFRQAVNTLLADVRPEQSEQLRAEIIYHAFCPLMTYDYRVLETRENVDAYYAYINHRGVCVTFATAYSQLLTQVGIENTLATGSDSGGVAHVWNTVTLGGQKYFCDPTYELGYKQGTAFAYFGMTLEDRLSDGTKVDYTGRYVTVPIAEVDIARKALTIIPLNG